MDYKYIDYYIKLGLNIQYYRKLHNRSQDELAELCGIQRTHMGKIEQANSGASLDTLFAISEALDVPVSKFFEFRD